MSKILKTVRDGAILTLLSTGDPRYAVSEKN